MKESTQLAGATERKCHDWIHHINESSYSVMKRKIKSISNISVSNEFSEAWRNIPFNVFYVIRDNLAPHQLVVSRQSILIIFPFCQQCPLFFSVSLHCVAHFGGADRDDFFFLSIISFWSRRTKAFSIWNINDGENSNSLKICHFSNHLMCVRASVSQPFWTHLSSDGSSKSLPSLRYKWFWLLSLLVLAMLYLIWCSRDTHTFTQSAKKEEEEARKRQRDTESWPIWR